MRSAACRGVVAVIDRLTVLAGSTGTGMLSMNLTLVMLTIAAGRPSAIKSVSNTCGIWPSSVTRTA